MVQGGQTVKHTRRWSSTRGLAAVQPVNGSFKKIDRTSWIKRRVNLRMRPCFSMHIYSRAAQTKGRLPLLGRYIV